MPDGYHDTQPSDDVSAVLVKPQGGQLVRFSRSDAPQALRDLIGDRYVTGYHPVPGVDFWVPSRLDEFGDNPVAEMLIRTLLVDVATAATKPVLARGYVPPTRCSGGRP
jgi:hypothetical protein